MHRFSRANVKFWQKPLVSSAGRILTAELAVLALELGPHERGLWLNSRKMSSGVAELLEPKGAEPKFVTRREELPAHVAETLVSISERAQLSKGCPDLVIWRTDQETFRLVEVKCPHWDAPSAAQDRFMREAERFGVSTKIVEWEFG